MKKTLLTLILTFIVFGLVGCSFFEEDAEGVKDVTVEQTEEGDVKIMVYYYNGSDEPKEELIPSGIDGKDGLGIDTVQVFREADSRRSKVVITLTDNTQKEFYVPDGVRIDKITSEYDEGTGEYYMYVKYTDGEVSDGILLPRGKEGIGIDTETSTVEINDDGSVYVKWNYTDGASKEFTIPAGKEGVGIQSITPSEEGGHLNLNILYTDGTTLTISFSRTSIWFQGYGEPTLAANAAIVENAIDGDFYLDIYGKKIYKLATTWQMLVDFNKVNDTYTVTFVANDSEEAPADPYENKITNIEHGSYLTGRIPTPTRTGYTFVGWATTAVVTPVTGYLTDLTPITSNLTLYAIWKPIA